MWQAFCLITAAGISLQIMRCIRIAVTKVEELTKGLRQALDTQDVARIARRVRRHTPLPAGVAVGA